MKIGRLELIDPTFRPYTTDERFKLAELQAQKEWFQGLKDAIESDDKEIALQMVRGALLLLDRQMNERQSRKDKP